MLRSAASKVMWVGRTTVFLIGLAVILALIFGMVSRATAHSGSTGLFHLNHNNPASALSTLTGTLAGAVLKVDNNGAGPALSLEVGSGQAPLTVNASAGKATNLNADRLDDREASSFADATHQHTGTDITSGTVAEARIDAAIARDGEVVPTVEGNDGSGSGLDADLLDGKDSSEFQPSNPCPSGTLFHEGACIETAKRGPAAFPNAESVCLQAERRLPTVAELQTFRLRGGQDFGTAEYTSQAWTDATGSTRPDMAMLVNPSGAQTPTSVFASAAFRCVAAPNVAPPSEAWEAAAQSDLRNAATAANACAADNDGSYVSCGTAEQLSPYGFEKSPDVTYVNLTATASRWVSATQHSEGGSAYQFDSATGNIQSVPRF
jgi:hypothetical protein